MLRTYISQNLYCFLYSTQYAALINCSEALFVWWLWCLVLGHARADLQIG